jgi:4-amino-4-deoxy-L-arabinose transferase-like glycosyltransferase
MSAGAVRQLAAGARWRGAAVAFAPLAIVAAVALAVRLIALSLSATAPIEADGANFVRTAENLRHGYGYNGIRGSLNAVHLSLYPVAVALLALGARVQETAIALSLLAGTLLVLPVYDVARRLGGGSAALAAAALVALHPLAVQLSVQPLADMPALALATAGIAAFLRSFERPRYALAAGALFGLAYCTRSEGLGYAAVAALAALAATVPRGEVRRQAALRLGGLVLAFAVFAVPYAVAVSRATGHVRLDAKGPVNYAIGTRIAAGVSYAQAADELGPGLREDGAELGAGFYQTHPGIGDPPLGRRLALAARVAPAQARRLARVTAGLAFGTPLFALLALAGLLRGLARPRVRWAYLVLAAFAAVDLAALCTLDHLWPRYAVAFVPCCAIWAAEPLVAAARALRARVAPADFAALAALAAVLVLTGLAVAEKRLAAAAGDATALRRAGAWIDAQSPGPKLILAVGSEIAYYAHGDWMPLPYASQADVLAYLHRKRPTYVVLEASAVALRPYLAGWLAHGIPDPAARAVNAIDAGTPGAIQIDEWRPADAGSAATTASSGAVDVLTAHNDAQRLGWNDRETALGAKAVGSRAFGKLFTLPVDGQAYAQPLIVSGVALPGRGRHDVLLAATENDSVYAFDANSGERLWVRSFASCCGVTPATVAAVSDDACESVSPAIGISSTPVVDRRTRTVYVVAKTMTAHGSERTFASTLHALDLSTGADRLRPAEIGASAPVSLRGLFAPGSSFKHGLKRLLGGRVRFDPRAQYSRTGLLLENGNLYFGFGSHCDIPAARGWVFAYRAADLAQVAAFATVGDWNDRNGAGVWQAGFGLTADRGGDVYFTTGNGPFDAAAGGRDYGDSLLRMSPDLSRVVDYFTPGTQAELAASDADFGGGAMIALPAGNGPYPRLGVASSKVRAIFLLDRDRLGRYRETGPDRALQVIGDTHSATDWCTGTCGGPAYFAGPGGEYVVNVWAQDALRVFRLERGEHPRLAEVAHTRNIFPGSGGAIPSVSSNGLRPGTGVVWATTRPDIRDVTRRPIELLAYDAADVSHLLYRGDAGLWPNKIGHPFLTPTIANGKVYVGGYRSISVFGLRAP